MYVVYYVLNGDIISVCECQTRENAEMIRDSLNNHGKWNGISKYKVGLTS